MHEKDPLSRLTGRVLKDVCLHNSISSRSFMTAASPPWRGAGCDGARNFNRFLAFGLTLPCAGPTVTVRNRHFQLPLARGP